MKEREKELWKDLSKTIKENKALIKAETVSHPAHYSAGRKYEPRKVISDWELNFNLGNVIKYVSRAGRKDPAKTIEDLEKAKQYIEFEIEELTDEKAKQ